VGKVRTIVLNIPAELLEEVERMAKLEERSRQAQLRYLIRLGLEVAARRRALPGGEAAGPAEHQSQSGGETDAPTTQQ
jgi:metal-responsive CopG/Arc/MetJ family transcriptional regulator